MRPATIGPATEGITTIEGQRNETFVRDDRAARLFPDVHPVGLDEAVARARSEAAAACSATISS